MLHKVTLSSAFARFSDHWSPKVVGELNGQQVKLVKFQGPFVWHHHDDEDELFLVVKGSMVIKLRDGDIRLEEGEFVVIPRTAHKSDEPVMLDGTRLEDLERSLGLPLRVVDFDGLAALFD